METPSPPRLPFHYGWVIVATGTLCIAACLGLGRFALGMILPSMGKSLGLSFSQMGLLGTANFVGYLFAVIASGALGHRIGTRKLIVAALLLVGITMVLSSRAEDFHHLVVLYSITGIGSGAANVPLMALVSAWFTSRARGKAAGYIVIGSGFAIMFSGKFIPYVNQLYGPEGWRLSWMVLGIIVVVIALIAGVLLRDRPGEKGLNRIGGDKAGGTAPDRPRTREETLSAYRRPIFYYLGLIYLLFGFTYVIFATFIVTVLVHEHGLSEALAGNFWVFFGLLSLFSGPVFSSLSDRIGRKAGLMMVFGLQMTSYLLVASGLPGAFLYLAVFLSGVVAWSIPGIMAAAAGDHAGAARASEAFGLITFIFGIGQILGPLTAGYLAESTGSFTSSFYLAGALAGVALLLSCFIRPAPARSAKPASSP